MDFDRPPDRIRSDSLKWGTYGPDVLPLWVADLDFPSPPPVLQALHDRVSHGVFGYSRDLPELKEAVCDRLLATQGWRVQPEEIVLLPGLVTALNVMCRMAGEPGDAVLTNTPVYPPFLSAPVNQGRVLVTTELAPLREGSRIRYELDLDAMEEAAGPGVKLLLLCSPQNPTGRAFTREELTAVGEFCDRRGLLICSDEIHGDLLLGRTRHFSLGAICPELSARTVTLLAPSKTWNIPTLGCSLAVIQDPDLRRRFQAASAGIVPDVGSLGQHAALAAYRDGEEWLEGLLAYLTANRDFLVEQVSRLLPGIRTTCPEATYLAWLDCRNSGIAGSPFRFFLQQAGVALNDGRRFGPGGEGFVRLNFGCPRALLSEALDRMARALAECGPGAD